MKYLFEINFLNDTIYMEDRKGNIIMDLLLQTKINIDSRMDGLIWQINRLDPNQDVHLSLENVQFAMPESIILLITLSKYIYDRTCVKVIWKNTKEPVYAYLDRIGIGIVPFIELERSPKWFHLNFSKSARSSLNLIEMKIMEKPKQCDEMISDTKRILHNWFQDRIASQYTKQVSEYIMHIAGNSLEHSEKNGKGICYYTLQRYEISQRMQIKLAFGDTGMGIRNSLKTYNEWLPENDGYAIKKAFFDGLSSRDDQSGGLGFRSIRSTMGKYGGEIAIRSGRAVMHYNPLKKEPWTVKFSDSLPGTQTVFTLL